jgi:hypothetical protein
MKIADVKWKQNFPSRGVQARDALKAIEKLKNINGGVVSPEQIVAAAKDTTHALHPIFEWDDQKAAAGYRRIIATKMLSAIEVTYREMPKTPMRHFEVIKRKQPGSEVSQTYYSTVAEVMADPDARDRLVADAVKSLIQFRRRYEGLSELEVVMRGIDEVLANLTAVDV